MTARQRTFLQGYGPLLTAVLMLVTVLVWGLRLEGKADAATGQGADQETRLRLLEKTTTEIGINLKWMRERIEKRDNEREGDGT